MKDKNYRISVDCSGNICSDISIYTIFDSSYNIIFSGDLNKYNIYLAKIKSIERNEKIDKLLEDES